MIIFMITVMITIAISITILIKIGHVVAASGGTADLTCDNTSPPTTTTTTVTTTTTAARIPSTTTTTTTTRASYPTLPTTRITTEGPQIGAQSSSSERSKTYALGFGEMFPEFIRQCYVCARMIWFIRNDNAIDPHTIWQHIFGPKAFVSTLLRLSATPQHSILYSESTN